MTDMDIMTEDSHVAQHEMSNLQDILAQVFDFSPADIAANRAGKISAAQKERITRKHYANSRLAWVLFGIFFGLGLFGFSAEMIRTGNIDGEFLLRYLGVTAFFGLIVWAFILYYRHRMKRTLREGSVQPVKGTIHVITERHERVRTRYFYVGNHRFRIERYSDFVSLQQSGVAGREAVMYVSAPWRDLLSVVLQA